MKGVILAGGRGSRLSPLTPVVDKLLLPVYDRAMIFHPLQTLVGAGIDEILIIANRNNIGPLSQLLGDGNNIGAQIHYRIQEEPQGMSHAVALAEKFAQGDSIAVIAGDNIIEDDLQEAVQSFEGGARVFLHEVSDPERFGVPELDGDRVVKITEKPESPDSSYAVIAFYLYDKQVFDAIRTLEPSDRGELEITDLNNWYIEKGQMDSRILTGFWSDAGTFESLFEAAEFVRNKKLNEDNES